MTRAEEYAKAVEDLNTRRARLLEQERKRRRREERFTLAAIVVTAVVNLGYLIRGTETSFRSTVVTLLTVIAVCVARTRR